MSRAVTLSVARLRREGITGAIPSQDPSTRPLTRSECVSGPRPCPYVSCKWHLYLDVDPYIGSLKLNFPDLEPDELEETCALDVADQGGTVLEKVGSLMNITRERVRQLQERTLVLVRDTSSRDDFDERPVSPNYPGPEV